MALILAPVSCWREQKQKVPFSRFQARDMTADWLATTLIFTLMALHCGAKYLSPLARALVAVGLLLLSPATAKSADKHRDLSPGTSGVAGIHYDKQLSAYREMRDKVERGSVSEVQWQAGQDLKEFGLETLREVKWAGMMQGLTGEVHKQLAPSDGTSPNPRLNHLWFIGINSLVLGAAETGKLFEDFTKIKKAADELQRFANLPEAQRTNKAKLEAAIAQGEILRKALMETEKKFGYKRENDLNQLTGGIMAGLHLAAGFASGNDEAAREKHFVRFTQESSGVLLKQAEVLIKQDVAANSSVGLYAALARVYGELAVRFSVAGASHYLGTKLVREAELMKENTLSDLNYRILVADYEKDKVLAAQRRIEHGERTKEPGGIKFSRQRADDLALKLDIDSVAYDPVRGRLVLSGSKKTEEVIDMDIFADVLRLAVEEHEPFFSMDVSRIEDWDFASSRFAERLRKKYSIEYLAAKVRGLSSHPIKRGNRSYYYTTAYDLDAGLFADANEGRDISEKLVFSPNWLRYSKVGWVLYEADMAIKAVAGGFLERWPDVIPSPAWKLSDFNPAWLNRRERQRPGRANFELDKASLVDPNGHLSLAEIRPKLYVTFREAGTDNEVKPQPPEAKAISDHFTRNWRTYVERVPELGRLQSVYKAYVAARYLVKKHPGLAERIRSLPRQLDWPEQPPLRVIRPRVIRVAYEGDQLVPLDDERQVWWDIGGGYGGGAVFKYNEKINDTKQVAAPAGWTSSALLDPASRLDSEEQGDQAAVALEIGEDPMPPEPLLRAAGLVSALLLGAALLGAALRQWDWQQLEVTRTCAHCATIHAFTGKVALFGSALSASSLFFLLGLPLLAAWHGGGEERLQLALSMLLLVGAAAAFTLLGELGHAGLRRFRLEARGHRGLLPAFFFGAQLSGFTMLAALWQSGPSAGAIAATCLRLLGPKLGERLFVQLGGPGPLAWASWALAGGLLAVMLSRWAAPLVLGSRPLLFFSFKLHRHSLYS